MEIETGKENRHRAGGEVGKMMAKRRRYFFFDYDGTLTAGSRSDAAVPPSTRRALDRLRAEGHFVAIATGRLQVNIAAIARMLGIRDYISDGGNGITLDHKLVSLEPLPREGCIELIDELEALGIPWGVTVANETVRRSRDRRYFDAAKITASYMREVIDPTLDPRGTALFMKVFVACSPEREAEIPALRKLPRVRFNADSLIIEPDDKGNGIRRTLRLLGADPADVVVFGDGTNDLRMFDPAWTSIAMGNANPALQAKADFVTHRSSEDGIEFACRHFGWM